MLIWLKKLAVQLAKDERGATAIEYGLIAALISVVIIVALLAVGGALTTVFNLVANCLGGAAAGVLPTC
ncbi:MAG: Flp family type IVb pilin [Alphaproteobacteria bacterium]